MEKIIALPTKESPNAGKGGEPTAAAGAVSARQVPANLTPDGVTSLLSSSFAEPETPPEPGLEVPPVATGAVEVPPGETPEEIPPVTPDPSAEVVPVVGTLPEHLEAELAQWEERGGALPASLQKLVERRIGKVVGEREAAETRATTAEAEVSRLTTELASKGEGRGAPASVPAEARLQASVAASTKFLKDARPYVGGYATPEQKARVEKFMQDASLDDNGLRQRMDEVTDWLTIDVPKQEKQITEFKQQEAQFAPLMAARFGSLRKKDSPELKIAGEILSIFPELTTRTPGHGLALGTYVLGKIAAAHLLAASKDGDVVETLKALLTKHAPIPAKGAAAKPGVLPGKAPARVPTGGSPIAGRAPNGAAVQQDQASQELRDNPTAENVEKSLRMALR